MKTTGRKFKCIGLEEKEAWGWKKYFEIGQVYEELRNNQGRPTIELLDNQIQDRFQIQDRLSWYVDSSQFELIK